LYIVSVNLDFFQPVSSDIVQNSVWVGKTFIDLYLSWNIMPSLFKKWYEGEIFCSVVF